MEVTGKIKMVGAIQEVSASFRKREVVVTTEEQYPQHIMIEFTQAKVDDLNGYQIGEPVKVSINLRGREWVNPQGEVKYFNSIQGWRIERMMAQQTQQQDAVAAPPMPAPPVFEPATNFNEEEHDDLPF
jgi:translation initiation factor IF-3